MIISYDKNLLSDLIFVEGDVGCWGCGVESEDRWDLEAMINLRLECFDVGFDGVDDVDRVLRVVNAFFVVSNGQ